MKSSRPLARVQQDREYRDRNTDIILTRKSRELKELVKELDAEVRDSTKLQGSSDVFWQLRLFVPHDDKTSSSSVSYTESRAPNSPPPNTISETEARLFARYDNGSGWYEWTSTRFEDDDGDVVVHPVYGECVLWIEKGVVGWVRRRWLRGREGNGQGQSQSQAPPTFSQPQPPPSSSSPSSSSPSISQPPSPAVSRIKPLLNPSQALPLSVPKSFSTFTIKPPRPLTKAQQARQLQDGEAYIDVDATKAVLTQENRELKKRVKELEGETLLRNENEREKKRRRKLPDVYSKMINADANVDTLHRRLHIQTLGFCSFTVSDSVAIPAQSRSPHPESDFTVTFHIDIDTFCSYNDTPLPGITPYVTQKPRVTKRKQIYLTSPTLRHHFGWQSVDGWYSTSNENSVIDLTLLDSDEEDEETPKEREREVIGLSDLDDDDEDEVREVPRVPVSVKSEEGWSGRGSGSGLDYGTSRSHSGSEEEEDEGEEMQPEPDNGPPPMDVSHKTETETNPSPPHNEDPSPVPVIIKPDTPSPWDLHHIPPTHMLSSYVSIFYHLGKRNRLYCRKCAEERSHRVR
ncbi:hypothetical protein PQX77_010234 [Marasmius sp. AFHP31]|nr:hypothetical protein PQX77_010234 [Marasmius sp. AFHP31]